MIDADVKLGKGVRIFNPDQVNIFGCEIGEETFIGPFVEITRGVKIGRRCLIQSHSFLCDSVTLEDDVFVGHGVMFTNDLYPLCERKVSPFKTLVRNGASLGTHSTILCGIEIGEHAIIGAGAVVTKSVRAYSIVAGNPAKELRAFASVEEMREFVTSRQGAAQ